MGHDSRSMTGKQAKHSALDGWMDVFRTGEHTDSSGDKRTWNEAELDSMAASHDTADPVPVVVGHPETDAPAYGWVDKVRRVGDRLQAKLKDIDPGFRALAESGRYGPRSVALDKSDDGWRLRHLGFLGAAAPAVSGLSPSQFTARFSGPAAHVYEFADDAQFASPETQRWGFRALARFMRRFRERTIEKDGMEAADAVAPEWDIEAVADAGEPDETPQFTAAPVLPAPGPKTHEEEDDMSQETEQQQAALSAEQAKLDERKAAFAKREVKFALKERRREAMTELESHVAAGRVLPGEREGLAAFMAALPEGETTFTFSAGGDAGGEVTKTPRAYFSELIARFPKRIDYNETAGGASAPVDGQDTNRVVAEARKLMAATPGLTIDQAVRQVTATQGG